MISSSVIATSFSATDDVGLTIFNRWADLRSHTYFLPYSLHSTTTKMASNPILPSEALAALSISSANESVLSLANLPRELGISVAGFLDLKDLLNLEATSKSHKQLARNGMNPVWKQLRDSRWAHGKLLWHAGPTFERSSDGVVIAVDNDLANWRDEVKRRVEIDNSLPERLARYAAATDAANAEEAREIQESFMPDGSDIYDWLVINHDPGEVYYMYMLAIINALMGRMSELEVALSLASRAAEGGVQFAAEFVHNQENNLTCELARCSFKNVLSRLLFEEYQTV